MNRSCFIAIALMGTTLAGAQNLNGVPKSLMSRFKSGVNITRWFCYLGPNPTTQQFETYFTEDDFATLKRIHATFVRLCVSPDVILHGSNIRPDVLEEIDRGLARLKAHHLAVLWDLHDNGQMKLDAPGHDNRLFVEFWSEMARHYRGRSYDSLVFELVNEPQFNQNPDVWFALQAKTVQAIRAIDPKRTIMVSSNSWSNIDNLKLLKKLAQSNLIYTFHCYDPFFFTHQGATWAGDQVKPFRHVPFPSSPEAVANMLNDVPEGSRDALKWYGSQKFDANYLYGRLRTAADWAEHNHVPIVMGEFGAYPLASKPEDRSRWFDAMRYAINRLKMPFCLWGYDDGFGIGREKRPDGSLKLDPIGIRFFNAN
jgi:aryl-phospho-beta-D-glucosidase BglC (GH1 family)